MPEVTMRGGESVNLSVHDKSKTNVRLDKGYANRGSNGIGEKYCAMIPYLYVEWSGAEPLPTKGLKHQNWLDLMHRNYLFIGVHSLFLSGPVYFGAAYMFSCLYWVCLLSAARTNGG